MRRFEVLNKAKGITSVHYDPADARKTAFRAACRTVDWDTWAAWLTIECGNLPTNQPFRVGPHVEITTYVHEDKVPAKLRNVKEYEAAFLLVDLLFDSEKGSREGRACHLLASMMEDYEEEHYSV